MKYRVSYFNYRINIAFNNVILYRLNGVTLTTLYPSNENERRTQRSN